jgi:kynureninase
MRPVVTGWFAEFDALADSDRSRGVRYGPGAARWAGATYDPTPHYRAAAVFDFFLAHGLTPEHLRRVSQHQVGLLADRCAEPPLAGRVRAVGVEGGGGLGGVAGFLALEVGDAASVQRRLHARGVHADHRGSVLRLGPAPYLTDAQLEEAASKLGEVLREDAR